MNKKQPKIVPPKTSIQQTLDTLAALGLAGFILSVLLEWPGLPDTIPHHFNAAGEPDGYGSKYILMLLPLLSIGNYFLFTYLNRRPYAFNYPVPITEENAGRQYTLARNMMSALNAGIILIFFLISWQMVAMIQEEASGLGWWFMPLVLGITFLPILIYLFQAWRKPA